MAKRATAPQIAGIELERGADAPLREQIDRAFRRAILEGRLAGGSRIPSSRALAEQLGVSRLTVVSAFEQLVAEGYLESRVGSGTNVACVLPGEGFGAERPRAPGTAGRRGSRPITLSTRGARISGFAPRRQAPHGAPRPFRLGAPALDAFPYAEWIRLSAACRKHLTRDLLGYGDPAGYRPLREAIAAYLGPVRGVRCSAENVVVLSGAQQAFGIALRMFTDPGDPVWVEDPGYAGARGAATAAGARVTAIPVDREGLTLGRADAPAPRLVFVTPSHQFPLGMTMSLVRRLQLLGWAGRCHAVILEDDYGSEYRYTGRPLAALQGLDDASRVIYVGSMSKVLFPALRVGYAVVPNEHVDAFTAAKGVLDGQAPLLEQATVAEFMRRGHFVRHVARMRALYRERQTALLDSAGRHLDGLLDVQPTATGMHLVAWLPRGVDDRLVAARAAAAGVEVAPLSAFRVARPGPPGLVLGFAASSRSELEAACIRLAAVIGTLLRGRGGKSRAVGPSPGAPAAGTARPRGSVRARVAGRVNGIAPVPLNGH